MVECELCGKKNADRKTELDGAILTVCGNCVGYGKEIARVEIRPVVKKEIRLPDEMNKNVRFDAAKIIKTNREKRGLTQEQLAKELNEKSSLIKRVEEGWIPPFSLLEKFEKFFKVNLIEETMEVKIKAKKIEKLTLGDIAEVH